MVGSRLKELLRHSAIYGLGSIVARVIGVLLLPLYTRYLTPSDYGLIETLVALSAVLTALVAQAMKSAFFRFYFDSEDIGRRLLVVRTAFWYVMAASTATLALGVALSHQISWALFHTQHHADLVVAAFVGRSQRWRSALSRWRGQRGLARRTLARDRRRRAG